jgi:hypothetical protein
MFGRVEMRVRRWMKWGARLEMGQLNEMERVGLD